MTAAGFRHADRERTILFGRGVLEAAGDELPERYVLLSTARAVEAAPGIAAAAAAMVEVPAGRVEALAADLIPQAGDGPLVALGGGRVVDTAKAIAAATGGGRPVAAIPTSLSAAEMTRVHRHARGVPADTPRVRPGLVINDPALSASQPLDELAASSANAFGHALTALVSLRTTPLARAVGGEAAARLAAGWAVDEPDRDELALGALLAGWAVDHSGLGPHHALAQTAVRTASLAHSWANAALLPLTAAAYRERDPGAFARLDALLGRPVEAVAEDFRRRAGATGLGDMRDDAALFDRAVEAAAQRAELSSVQPPLERDEVAAIFRAAAGAAGG